MCQWVIISVVFSDNLVSSLDGKTSPRANCRMEAVLVLSGTVICEDKQTRKSERSTNNLLAFKEKRKKKLYSASNSAAVYLFFSSFPSLPGDDDVVFVDMCQRFWTCLLLLMEESPGSGIKHLEAWQTKEGLIRGGHGLAPFACRPTPFICDSRINGLKSAL